ncbi:MAG: hypothetical protein ABGZ36_18780, partial [Actinomycetota bacterium]
MNVDEASHLVVGFLTDHVGPYGWTVSRSADDGRVHLRPRDDAVTTDAESRAKALRPHGPLLDLLGSMLSTVLSCDLARLEEDAARVVDRVAGLERDLREHHQAPKIRGLALTAEAVRGSDERLA